MHISRKGLERDEHKECMVVHLSFSGKFYGRENAAFSLVKALQGKIDAMMLLVIEKRTATNDRVDLINKLNGYGLTNETLYTDKVLSRNTLNQLSEKINKVRGTIIHCHCHKSALYAVVLKWLKKTDARIILTLHGLVLTLSPKTLLHYLMYYASVLCVDGVIGCSRQITASLARVPIIKRKVIAIRNGYENFTKMQVSKQQARQELSLICGDIAGKLLIANVGRLTKQKNPMMFLRIVNRIKAYCLERNIPVHFILAGDGELRAQVEQAARKLAILDCLSITGYVSNMEIVYAAADLIVLSSDWEGTPMCILEAMSYSLPTVAPSVGGIPDIIRDEVTGLLFARRHEDECFNQVTRLVESASLRQSIGEMAYDFYKSDLNYNIWATRHIQYYNSLRDARYEH